VQKNLDELRISYEKHRAQYDLQSAETEKYRAEANLLRTECEDRRTESDRLHAECARLRAEVSTLKSAADVCNNNNVNESAQSEVTRLQELRKRDLTTHMQMAKQLKQLRDDAKSLDDLKKNLRMSERNYATLENTLTLKDLAVEVLSSEVLALQMSSKESDAVIENFRESSSSDANAVDQLQSKITALEAEISRLQRAKTLVDFPTVHFTMDELALLNAPAPETPMQANALAEDSATASKRPRQELSVDWILKPRRLQYSESLGTEITSDVQRRTGLWLQELGDLDAVWDVFDYVLGTISTNQEKSSSENAPKFALAMRCAPLDLMKKTSLSECWLMAALMVAREVIGNPCMPVKLAFRFATGRSETGTRKAACKATEFLRAHL
jgi:myosin heavy subunit